MRLIITRHGETFDNINRICQGQTQGELTQEGLEQAKKLGMRFKTTEIDAVYSSDLKRAVDTAKEILKPHPKLKLRLDKRLRERYLGELQGRPFPPGWDWNNLPPDAETDAEMCKRAKEFIDDIYACNKTVLVVCHGGMKMALLNVIHNKPVSEFDSWKGIKNTSVSQVYIEKDGSHTLRTLNCIKHLE